MATQVNLGQYRGMVGWAPGSTYGTPLAVPLDYNVTAAANFALSTGCRLLRFTLPASTNALYVKSGPSGAGNLTVGTGLLILPGLSTPFVVGPDHTHLYWINAA